MQDALFEVGEFGVGQNALVMELGGAFELGNNVLTRRCRRSWWYPTGLVRDSRRSWCRRWCWWQVAGQDGFGCAGDRNDGGAVVGAGCGWDVGATVGPTAGTSRIRQRGHHRCGYWCGARHSGLRLRGRRGRTRHHRRRDADRLRRDRIGPEHRSTATEKYDQHHVTGKPSPHGWLYRGEGGHRPDPGALRIRSTNLSAPCQNSRPAIDMTTK